MPEFWWLSCPVCSITVESCSGQGGGTQLLLDPAVRTVLFIQRAAGKIQPWGRRMPERTSSGPSPTIPMGFGGGGGSSKIDRRPNPFYLTPLNPWSLDWLQRGHNRHLSWSRVMCCGIDRPVFFYCIYVWGLPWGGGIGSYFLFAEFLIFPIGSRWLQGSLLGLPVYLPIPLDAVLRDRCKNLVRVSKILWRERVYTPNGGKMDWNKKD